MDKITLTLNLTYQQATKVLALLNTSPESHTEPTGPKLSSEVQSPSRDLSEPVGPSTTAVPKNSKPKPKMASFGRNAAQIAEYEASEKSRIEELDKKEEERTAKQAAKQAVEVKQVEEVKAIKAIKASPKQTIAELPDVPWKL